MSAYSLLPNLDAVFMIMEGEASVMVKSDSRMKINSASVGVAELSFTWPPQAARPASGAPNLT